MMIDDHHHIFWPPPKTVHEELVFFFSKKKRGQKIQGVKVVFLDHIIIHEGPLPPSFCPSLLSRATLKGCIISTVALSLSLSRARKQQQLAFFGRSTPKRRLQQLLKRFSSPTKEREREIPRRKRYRLYRHKFDRSLQNRTPKRSALETEKTRPCSSSQKKNSKRLALSVPSLGLGRSSQ